MQNEECEYQAFLLDRGEEKGVQVFGVIDALTTRMCTKLNKKLAAGKDSLS